MIVARVYLVRHGETEENRQGIMQGQLDTELNAAGIEQAQLTAKALEAVPFERAYTSDLIRAAWTTEIILSKHRGVTLESQVALRERFLGDWQGRKVEGRGVAPPNIEMSSAFVERATAWWETTIVGYTRLLRPEAREGPAHVLAVSHGGFIGTLITNLISSGKVRCAEGVRVGRCWNTSISVVELDEHGTGTLVRYGDVAHLKVNLVEENVDEEK
ncbi:phosphoglycerate mutase-like protein [Obba rivulosa]|uniref:Phosphoglycerate mutase-like protein n=1 Tax=Obba rivulosa TaxID=1052685 RepID=A0A8E2AR90_9APHY|nr:phosphoglycerate mutase-like protein [Obba rivulosa]